MKFYHFYQNNSGGSRTAGMPGYLFVEAESAEEADDRAESVGVYFDGCENDIDCDCCGDRWHRSYEFSAEPVGAYEFARPWGVLYKGAAEWKELP